MSRQVTLTSFFKKDPPIPQQQRPIRSPMQLNFGRTIRKPINNNEIVEIVDVDDDEKKKRANGGEDDDDEATWMALAVEASRIEFEREQQRQKGSSISSSNIGGVDEIDRPSTSKSAATNIGGGGRENSTAFPGFDHDAGTIWIYPTNFPKRNYQFEIIHKSLFYNTLVTLPTGLGKTFIAAVVMYNFYRWYPKGKVVFMAPTKPLVAQQIEACYNIMGISQEHMAEMTGSIHPPHRKKLWDEKRIFFLTPQVINNDLQKELFSAESVKCLVIDEAHKATGEHAYCQVVRQLLKHTKDFRVLALSATPGSDLNAVQSVLSNLKIAHMELRSEDSPEIKKYTHERSIECIVVKVTGELAYLREKYEQVLQRSIDMLVKSRVLYSTMVQSCSLTMLLRARVEYRTHPPPGLPQRNLSYIERAFAKAIGLLHGYQLLSNMGMKALYSYLQGKIDVDADKKKSTIIRQELQGNPDLQEIHEFLKERFATDDAARNERLRFPADNESFFDRSHAYAAASAMSTQQISDEGAISHPKLAKLVDILIEHFKAHEGRETRVMVFAQYRDCVEEITELLNKRRPLVKAMKFVGQSSTRGSSKGITQAQQLEVVKRFKEGGYNTLVSTSVGEEGLDIGEVDLIVCYDATASPVRSVQRMGRTGRKRQGRIVMLVTEGREQSIFNSSEYSKKRVHKAIVQSRKFILYNENRRMVPFPLQPACRMMQMTVEKPYENAALAKRKVEENKQSASIKRFTGSLMEKELNEWERDFKLRDASVGTNLLTERKPLRILQQGGRRNVRSTTNNPTYLNSYASRQDCPRQASIVQSSLLSHSFVKMIRACQVATNSAFPTSKSELPYWNEITESSSCHQREEPTDIFLRPTTPRSKVPVKGKTLKRLAPPKGNVVDQQQQSKKRKRKATAAVDQKKKKKNAAAAPQPSSSMIISDSCQLIAEFKSTDIHVASNGEHLNLVEIFPPPIGTRRMTNRPRPEYSEPPRRLQIAPLTSRLLLDAMESATTIGGF